MEHNHLQNKWHNSEYTPEASCHTAAISIVQWTHQSCVTSDQQHTKSVLIVSISRARPQVLPGLRGKLKPFKNSGMDQWPSSSFKKLLFIDTEHKLILGGCKPQAAYNKSKGRRKKNSRAYGCVLHGVIRLHQAAKWETNTNCWLPQSLLQYKETSVHIMLPTQTVKACGVFSSHSIYFIYMQKKTATIHPLHCLPLAENDLKAAEKTKNYQSQHNTKVPHVAMTPIIFKLVNNVWEKPHRPTNRNKNEDQEN